MLNPAVAIHRGGGEFQEGENSVVVSRAPSRGNNPDKTLPEEITQTISAGMYVQDAETHNKILALKVIPAWRTQEMDSTALLAEWIPRTQQSRDK